MFFEQVVRKETGCASYVVGCPTSGECAVIDPLWNPEPFVRVAREHEVRIRYVIDTHSHADHVSGARRLVGDTGAELLLHERAEVLYPATRVKDGDAISLGSVRLEFLHTPGHRPEHIIVAVSDLSRSPEPWMLCTGDFILVGDISRPDLAQAGEEGAETLFDVALPRVAGLPDYVEVYPGHVGGST
ncbi:MAG: MBL fold metallo-hydrolase [bacterium]